MTPDKKHTCPGDCRTCPFKSKTPNPPTENPDSIQYDIRNLRYQTPTETKPEK